MSKEFEYAGNSTWMTTVGTDMGVVTVNDKEAQSWIRGGHVHDHKNSTAGTWLNYLHDLCGLCPSDLQLLVVEWLPPGF